MSRETCPVVKVDDGKGSYYVINESDFKADKHSKYGESKPVEKTVKRSRKAKPE